MTQKQDEHLYKGMGIFDIETGQGDPETILSLAKPFKGFQPLGEFDPSTVKTGNLKAQDKIDDKIQAAREAHETKAAEAFQKWEGEKMAYEEGLITKSPLEPLHGVVLAIGILKDDGEFEIIGEDGEPEEVILASFWGWVVEMIYQGNPFVGWNSRDFDMPFLVQRSWILGVDVPDGILDDSRNYLHGLHVDLMRKWTCGKYSSFASLDTVAKAFGFKGKEKEEVTGENFHHHWNQGGESREMAIRYLKADLVATRQLAERILGHPERLFLP